MKYEVIAISVWAVLFTCLYYYLVGLYHKPLLFQVIIISLLLLVDVCIIYLVYKKLIYSHLDTIKKNIEELEGLHIAEAPDDNFRA
jgi:membrane protein DedA with SNARE-associated domain